MQIEMSKENVQEQDVKFNPSTRYGWEGNASINFTGMEYSVLYNSIGEFLQSSITPISILKMADCYAVLQRKLVEMVENGVATEKPQESASAMKHEEATT